jgi:hypothetical protein
MKLDLTGQRFATKGLARGGAIGGPPSSADVHAKMPSYLDRILTQARQPITGPVGYASGGLVVDPVNDPESEPLMHGPASSEFPMSWDAAAAKNYLQAIFSRLGRSARRPSHTEQAEEN